nr:ABC transporter ATP-binding protein [uncultured Bacillus sp.]
MNFVLDIQELSVWYEENNFILEDIHLSLEKGHVYGLLGVNGAGKTTLLNTLTGVNRSFKGRFEVAGIEIGPETSINQWHESKKKRYFAADYPLLFTEITARQYVEFVHKIYQKVFKEHEFLQLAKEFHFMQYVDRRITELSLGNRQKIVLITGLLLQAPLFILDEPLVGLDVEAIEVFYQRIKEYSRGGGTVLFSSHLLEVVQRFCDQAIILHNKRILSIVELNENIDLHKEFFEVIANE